MNEFRIFCAEKGIDGSKFDALWRSLLRKGLRSPTRTEVEAEWDTVAATLAARKPIDRLLDLMEGAIKSCDDYRQQSVDTALRLLLRKYRDELPELDDYFHKAFRQIDVTNDGNIDMVIWHLIDASEAFWVAYEMVSKEIGIENQVANANE